MSGPLTGKVRSGLRWGVLGGTVQQLASLATTVVLVRVLTPDEFGVVVAANVVVAMAAMFTYLGIRLAIVRTPTLDETTLWTLFWMSTGLGVLTSGGCVALAGFAADALGQPAAAPYLRVLGALILVQTLGGVPRAVLQREMRFRNIHVVELVAAAAQVTTAITAALSGLGAWSLVVGYVAHATVLAVGYWAAVRLRPRLKFDWSCARRQLRFGAGMWTSTSLIYVVRNADYWAVSRVLGGPTLGIYYVAYVLPDVLRQRLAWITNEVMLPSFAGIQSELPRLRSIYERALGLHAAIGTPAMVGLGAISPVVVDVFFGARWSAAAAPMALVSIAVAAEFVTQPAQNLMIALGKTGAVVELQIGRAVVLVPGVFIAVHLGGLVAVAAVVAGSCIVTAIHAQLRCARLIQARSAQLLSLMLPTAGASLIMALAVFGVEKLLPASTPALVEMVVLAGVGAVVYPIVMLLLAPRMSRRLFADVRLLIWRTRKPSVT